MVSLGLNELIHVHCGLVMPYGNRSGPTLAQVIAHCLMAPSYYLNQCWLIISEVLCHSPQGNFTGNTRDIYPWHELKINNLRLQLHLPGAKELTHFNIKSAMIMMTMNKIAQWNYTASHTMVKYSCPLSQTLTNKTFRPREYKTIFIVEHFCQVTS